MPNKNHWETVYTTKQPNEVSWTQAKPQTSLDFIHDLTISKADSIIDIGGGDSNLVDFLLEEGYSDITVLDISEAALQRAKNRLGKKCELVTWIVSDITTFQPQKNFQIWHDRATFHFLTSEEQQNSYLKIISNKVKGHLVIGTFSENGPKKCSGLEIKQYSKESLTDFFAENFTQLKCVNEDHVTPFDTIQNFTFCSFRKN